MKLGKPAQKWRESEKNPAKFHAETSNHERTWNEAVANQADKILRLKPSRKLADVA